LRRFDDVKIYNWGGEDQKMKSKRTAIVTYGNGVLTALRARSTLAKLDSAVDINSIDIIDVPLISRVSSGLRKALEEDYGNVVFADICKGGGGSGGPLSGLVTELKKSTKARCFGQGGDWTCVNAAPTYNPLGDLSTFLNERDIIDSIRKLN